ncbi:unnamed protein product [Penicillium salamii]|nr:unnamed protein product [Penicillium salamii]CAG8391873.1 unnamed protein product [Penicillium salamii]
MAQPSNPEHVLLNGQTLEGGGQLVRIAIGLSALTGRPVSIENIRANRPGKTGLKRSHATAVKLLADVSGSKVTGGEVGSQSMSFLPRAERVDGPLVDLTQTVVQSKYDINISTAGAICLVFQALYPYMLYAGSQAPTPFIRVKITGGTNPARSPSFDYTSQVMAPNFAKLGLPPLEIILHERGWSSGPVYGPGDEDSSKRSKTEGKTSTANKFPKIDLMAHESGKITQIDLTVLAPDYVNLDADGLCRRCTLRDYIAQTTGQKLRSAMRKIHPSTFALQTPSSRESSNDDAEPELPVSFWIHTSEATYHDSHVYILLVAHTSSGFRIGHDILGSLGSHKKQKEQNKDRNKQRLTKDDRHAEKDVFSGATELARGCVEGFMQEISNVSPESDATTPVKKTCLDRHMRDQIVVFEALGEACHAGTISEVANTREDGRDWTLHTRTAQWVCRQVLGA